MTFALKSTEEGENRIPSNIDKVMKRWGELHE